MLDSIAFQLSPYCPFLPENWALISWNSTVCVYLSFLHWIITLLVSLNSDSGLYFILLYWHFLKKIKCMQHRLPCLCCNLGIHAFSYILSFSGLQQLGKLLEKILTIVCKILTEPFDKTFSLIRAEWKKNYYSMEVTFLTWYRVAHRSGLEDWNCTD